MLWIGVAISAVAVAMVAFSGGAAGPLWSGAVLALFATSALLAAGRRPFGGGRPRWIEMDAIPGGRRLTPDARVHFFTERRLGLPMLVLSSIWTLVFGSGAIIGVAIGANGRPQALIAALVLAVVAVLFGYAVVRAVRVGVRDGALGRRAAGLAIGRDGSRSSARR